MEVASDHDQYAWFNLISLFPPTYKYRANGLRKYLAGVLQDLRPKYMRIAGGSNLLGLSAPFCSASLLSELTFAYAGNDIAGRFNWTHTLGPLEKRPGRMGYWTGYQTEGLGLKELLDMCEDLGASPVMGVWDGYAADDESVPNTHQLDKYIESAIDQLQYVGNFLRCRWYNVC